MQLTSKILAFGRICYAVKQYMQLSNMQLSDTVCPCIVSQMSRNKYCLNQMSVWYELSSLPLSWLICSIYKQGLLTFWHQTSRALTFSQNLGKTILFTVFSEHMSLLNHYYQQQLLHTCSWCKQLWMSACSSPISGDHHVELKWAWYFLTGVYSEKDNITFRFLFPGVGVDLRYQSVSYFNSWY